MNSFCSYYNLKTCRSCEWITLPYGKQILDKETILTEALSFLGPILLEPSVVSPQVGFRNRAKLSVTGSVKKPIVGLIGETVLDQGRELLNCPIHHPKLNALIMALPTFITEFNLHPYKISKRHGELKGIIAYYSTESEQLYLRFILRSAESISNLKKMILPLQSRFPKLVCVSANIQPIPHAILEGPEEIFLTREHSIAHVMAGMEFRLVPQAFVQTNFQVALELYKTAAEWVGLAGPKIMLELFCGQGAFSFFSANKVQQLLGIEINAEAVAIANRLVRSLGLEHLNFICADARVVQNEVERFNPDLVLVNPPRAGLGAGLEMILKNKPKYFLYSSCSIDSLVRDLKALAQDYAIKKVQLFDLFPHTAHFETLIWMELKADPVL